MNILFLAFLTSFYTHATTLYELDEKEISPETEEILVKKPEKYLRNESMIYNFNTDLGIKDQRTFTGDDKNRLSLSFHVAGDYEHIYEILGGEVNYMTRSNEYDRLWWGAQVFQHRAYFQNITENVSIGGANSEASFQRPLDVKDTILGFGPGVGYRFKLLLDFFNTEDTFESIDVFLNGIVLNESFSKERYQGFGLATSYGLHKRTQTSFFYGGKFSYHVASVTRRAIGDESKSERSLSLGWLSVAFEMGFYY
jgi:hypothetical protein